jgi:hypothetical protein
MIVLAVGISTKWELKPLEGAVVGSVIETNIEGIDRG